MPSSNEPGTAAGLAAGLRATVRASVTEADTAEAMGSGNVPVLATPRLLALAEAATVAAVGPYLADGLTTVGTAASLEHRTPSPPGAVVVVEAELTEVDGRRLVFDFIARADDVDDDVVIGAGTVERVVLDRARFLARVQANP
ncbi:MAG TPA: hotdog domain-containing protein [Streptosporangiaceae bacterium]|nr:hotdog domain-containing protein [Streptosporangiaceae bacterium]